MPPLKRQDFKWHEGPARQHSKPAPILTHTRKANLLIFRWMLLSWLVMLCRRSFCLLYDVPVADLDLHFVDSNSFRCSYSHLAQGIFYHLLTTTRGWLLHNSCSPTETLFPWNEWTAFVQLLLLAFLHQAATCVVVSCTCFLSFPPFKHQTAQECPYTTVCLLIWGERESISCASMQGGQACLFMCPVWHAVSAAGFLLCWSRAKWLYAHKTLLLLGFCEIFSAVSFRTWTSCGISSGVLSLLLFAVRLLVCNALW